MLSGWKVTVENTSFSSIHIRWINLTSLLNRQVRHYIVFLNMNNGSSLSHKITDGRQLATEVAGLKPSSNYTVQVFGIDETGQPYRSVAEDARTTKSKEYITCKKLFFFNSQRLLTNSINWKQYPLILCVQILFLNSM